MSLEENLALTEEEVIKWFQFDEIQYWQFEVQNILDICRIGYQQGKNGWYQDCDFSSDADWVYGVGGRINRAEERLDDCDGYIFDLYCKYHSKGLLEWEKDNSQLVIPGLEFAVGL